MSRLGLAISDIIDMDLQSLVLILYTDECMHVSSHTRKDLRAFTK